MKQKQAVLVVSFGTSHLDTLEKTIAAIEQTIGTALPEFTLRRAFTSSVIMKKLAARDGLQIDNVPQALEHLAAEGYTHVIIQPTHIINGEEFDKLCSLAAPFADRLTLSFGTPLLTSIDDCKNAVSAVMKSVEAPAEDEALIFMGHGTSHHANASYALLEYMFHDFGWDRAFVGTVEGYPELTEVLHRLADHPGIRRVRLQPLMVVAGDHANNDMAGADDDSWVSRLRAAGYEVQCVIRGLGEYAAIRTLFAHHAVTARSAMKTSPEC